MAYAGDVVTDFIDLGHENFVWRYHVGKQQLDNAAVPSNARSKIPITRTVVNPLVGQAGNVRKQQVFSPDECFV